jgi:hypothetical protein
MLKSQECFTYVKLKEYQVNRSSVLMLKTVWAKFRDGTIEFLEPMDIPDGSRILVTVLPDEESDFWQQTSQSTLDAVWDNQEDDIYAELLKK